MLRYYHIHISQLSVIGAAKVSHFEILCYVHGFEPTVGLFRCFYVNSKNKGWISFSKRQGNDAICYTKPLDSLKSWNDRFFWVDTFACPASFPWNSSKSVPKDPFLKSSEFNAEHYATLVAYPDPFHKYPEPFLCLIGISQMDLLSFIQTADPIKVRVGERQRAEDEPKLLDATVGRVVPLLPIAPARAESELDASVDRLFDEGGSGNLAEKRKMVVSNAGGPSHLPKKLREDHGTSTGPSVAGKSMSALQRLLAGVVLNPEVGVAALPTLPFITSPVSVTPEQESEDQTDSMVEANLQTITAPLRFVMSSDSSHHSGANIAEAEVDSFARPSIPLMTLATTVTSTVDPATTVKEKFVGSSVFGGDSSSGGADHTIGGFSDLIGSDFIVGGIRTVINPDTDLQKVYVPQWSVTNGSRLGAARQMSRSAEVRMRAEYNIREMRRLNSVLLAKEAEAAEAIRLYAEASKFEVIEKSLQDEVIVLKDCNTTLEKEKSELNVKVADLAASVKVREQEAVDLDAMVTSVKSQNDNLINQVHRLETSSAGLKDKVAAYKNFIGQLEKFQDEKMAEVNEKFDKLCADFVEMALHLEEKFYPHLMTTIYGRRWLLTHGMELVIAKCLNSTEYLSILGAAIGKAVKKGMQEGLSAGITHGLEGRKLTDLTVPIHHSLDQRVIDATALSLSLDPLSFAALEGTKGTSGTGPKTTTALSVTFASTSSIPPISIDDYDVVHADGQEGTSADG
ncbi:hypothetical protein Tco_1301515 [Tanacetum coccineum]